MKNKNLTIALETAGVINLLFGGADVNANDPNSGVIDLDALLNSTNGVDTARGVHYPGYNDIFVPGEDHRSTPLYLEGDHNLSLKVDGVDTCYDAKSVNTNMPFNMAVYYNGAIAEGEEPNLVLEFSFPYYSDYYIFGNRDMIFQQEDSDGIPNTNGGFRGDARALEAYGGGLGKIDFGKVPAGTYEPNTPILNLRLDFDKLLADLNNDNVVNLKDYAVMADYWMHEGRCIADISGPDGIPDINGIPDMIVDTYDLAVLMNQWLYTVEDSDLIAKIESAIQPVLIAGNYIHSGEPQKLFYGKHQTQPTKIQNSLRNNQPANKKIEDLLGLQEKKNKDSRSLFGGQYTTIDQFAKTPTNKVFVGSQNGKKLYRRGFA